MSLIVVPDDVRACRRLLREGSKSFHLASLMLPPRVRDDAAAVYAWCRVGDHAVDHSADPAAAVEQVAEGLVRVYDERPVGPVERAFAGAVAEHEIPRAVPEALVEGFAWDAEGREYETLEQVLAYCVRVGSTVGLMMSLAMGRRSTDTLRAAARLGVAMQLTNIARDVGEDAGMGRLYLPRALLRQNGVEPGRWLRDPRPAKGVRLAVRRLLDEADGLYATSWGGISGLPASCRPAIRAAALVYSQIGAKVRAAGFDSVTRRAWTGRSEKARLLARALAGRPGPWTVNPMTDSEAASACADRASVFLIEAVTG